MASPIVESHHGVAGRGGRSDAESATPAVCVGADGRLSEVPLT